MTPPVRPSHRAWHPEFPLRPARSPVFYGWVLTIIATLGVTASIPGQTIGMAAFTDPLMSALGLSRVEISTAYLVGTLVSGLLIPWGGRLIDHWGARRMMVTAALAMGVSLIVLAASDVLSAGLATLAGGHHERLFALTVVTAGFFLIRFWGQGMLTMASRNMVAKWFDRRRGMAVGVTGVATAFAFAASPAVLNVVVERLGWRWTWLVLAAVLVLVIATLAWVFARDNPEECGLEMDGGPAEASARPLHPDQVVHRDFTREQALASLTFWVFTLSFGWYSLFVTGYTFHVVDIGASIGLDAAEILRLFLYASVFAISANLACGWLSARMRVKVLLIAMNLMFALFALGPLLDDARLAATLIVIGSGVGGGLWSNLSGIVYARFFGRAHLGAITGVFWAAAVLSSALGPFLFGAVEALTGTYRVAFVAGLAVPLVMSVPALWANNPQRKP
ncbi:MAG: MFS transporter [Gammaproteobacteria bacterium]|nr:MFS transporter [Gammaproteobacteria bacterium]